ncbi:MAG: hypothetical protein SGPRY_010255 [Prymnesium sp.]
MALIVPLASLLPGLALSPARTSRLALGSLRLSSCPVGRAAVRSPPSCVRMLEGAGGSGRTGGGCDGGGGGDGRGGDDGEEEDASEEWVGAMLSKHGLTLDSVPADVLAALEAGRIGAPELANWAATMQNPLTSVLALSPYIRARLLSDPRLLSVLSIEIMLGVVMTLAAEKAARGSNFASELDFVITNQVLITCTNIALVLALTPAAAVACPPAPGTLNAYISRLPGFVLQQGEYTVYQRVACYVSKTVQFSVLGAGTSALGQYLTKVRPLGLISLRRKFETEEKHVELAPVLATSAAYSAFMGLSSNTRHQLKYGKIATVLVALSLANVAARYQAVNSFEALLLPKCPSVTRNAISTVSSGVHAVRTGNNFVGSSNWIWWAKQCGLQ